MACSIWDHGSIEHVAVNNYDRRALLVAQCAMCNDKDAMQTSINIYCRLSKGSAAMV